MTDHEKHEKAAFFALIRADPTNNDTRLVFADWCEEHGDMELAGMLRGGSRAWIEEVAAHIGITYEELMGHAAAWVKDGKDVMLDDGQFGFSATNVFYEVESDFWKHYAIMEGVQGQSGDFFRCCY
jgi:uncharacterized protein (TIGR02996 family)